MNLLRARRNKLSQRDAGFTLVELVVAMLVIAIVMVAIITVQARALTTNADSQARQAATAYANQAMEQLRSMPWKFLSKGLASNYLTASGGDLDVSPGDILNVNGATYPLKVANASNDQAYATDPWIPLFDATGSNKQTPTSVSGNGDVVTIRAYTTVDSHSAETVGLVVVATWGKRTDGSTEKTVLVSAAYAPASNCGDVNAANSPFLASCQALFDASSSSASVVTSISSRDIGDTTNLPLLPGLDKYSLQVSTAAAWARAASQQVSTVEGSVAYGGTTYDDNDSATQPKTYGWFDGFEVYSLRASDDITLVPDQTNPPTLLNLMASNSSTPNFETPSGGITYKLTARADDTRISSVQATSTNVCSTGLVSIPGQNPCAQASVGGGAAGGTANADFTVDGQIFHLFEVSGSGRNDHAWAARFSGAGAAGSLESGCPTVTGSGCVSAGAHRTVGDVSIGRFGGTWTNDVDPTDPVATVVNVASYGVVTITNYSDHIMTQRGVGPQSTATARTGRSGTLGYWNGSDYTTENLVTTPSLSATVAPVKYVDANGWTVAATGTVTVYSASESPSGLADTTCKSEPCSIDASTGKIVVSMSYTVTPTDPALAYVINVVTTVVGSQSATSFSEAANANP